MGIFKQALLNDYDREIPYFLWLSKVGDIGVKTYTKMQSHFGAPSQVYSASYEKLESSGVFTKKQLERIERLRRNYCVREEYERMLNLGISIIPREDARFPERLLDIPSSPIVLFSKGQPLNINGPIVSVIGARECSFYGTQVAIRLGELLAKYNITLVSGMARGIDSISQEACVNAGGNSIAVLGGGVDVLYPKESAKLYDTLSRKGTIISEYPPGTEPMPSYFALRNRIISGLSDVVCVVEAKEKSGTMITVDSALEQGREVYAVPGKITDITSKGCNQLIKQGAGMILDVEEFVMELANIYVKNQAADISNDINIEETRMDGRIYVMCEQMSDYEKRLLISMDETSFTGEQFAVLAGVEPGKMLVTLIGFCSKKLLKNMGAGRFRISEFGMKVRDNLLQEVN